MYEEINCFDQVPIMFRNSLIICDIDETLLYFPNHYNELFQNNISFYGNITTAIEKTNLQWTNIIDNTLAKPTDFDGFLRLINRLQQTQSKICFLTARSGHPENIEFTKKNFSQIDINYDAFTVLYSYMVPKGEYIKTHINLDSYSQIIFIDDMDHNLHNVYTNFGNRIQNYKFIMQ
jgi:hypothetical protein